MTLKEHYKYHSRKSIKPYKVLFILIVFAITIFHTFGRYANTGAGTGTTQAARWLLTINGEQISSNATTLSSPIQLINSSNGTRYIDIGDECYFDIIVNPASTEVAVTYSILVDLNAVNSSLPSGTTIKKYEKYNNSTSTLISTTNVNGTSATITGNINLSNAQTPLNSSDAVKYRVYCQMPNYANLTKNTSIGVVPQITVQQILGN